MDTSGLLASDQSRTTKFATVNFLKVAIAKATNLLFSKLLMVIMRLWNWSVLPMFKSVLAHVFTLWERDWENLSWWSQANWWSWKVTNNTIGKHQVYYERTIRDNTHSIQDMENAVMADITSSQPMAILTMTFVQMELLSEGSRHRNIWLPA